MKKFIGDRLGQLAKSDLAKGCIMAMLTALVTAIYTQLNSSEAHIPTVHDLLVMGKSVALVGAVYLMKQLGTNSDGKFLKKEPVPPVKDGEGKE